MSLRTAAARVKVAVLLCVDSLTELTQRAQTHPDLVLLVRLDAIGDFILWLDAAQETAKHYRDQGKRVVLAANAVWAAWAEQLAIFDEVVPIDRRRLERKPVYRYRAFRRIRRLGCSIAVQPTYSRELLIGDSIVHICGALERIGSSGDTSNMPPEYKRIADRWYTRLIAADPTPRMELLRNAEFVRGLGVGEFLAKVPALRPRRALPSEPSFLPSVPAGRKYYVVFPGASWNGKRWPLSSFAEVTERLYRKTGWHAVVCGGEVDCNLAENLCRMSTAPILNWAGRTSLSQLVEILASACLLLTNDTSAAHIGATLGVPVVCILGGGHYGRFMPYQVEQTNDRPLPHTVIRQMPCFGCNWECIYERSKGTPAPCIESISVRDVWHTISEALGFLQP